MKSRVLISISAFTLLVALVSPKFRLAAQYNAEGKRVKLVTFDAPGAGKGMFQGTIPYGIESSFASYLEISQSDMNPYSLRADYTRNSERLDASSTGHDRKTCAASVPEQTGEPRFDMACGRGLAKPIKIRNSSGAMMTSPWFGSVQLECLPKARSASTWKA